LENLPMCPGEAPSVREVDLEPAKTAQLNLHGGGWRPVKRKDGKSKRFFGALGFELRTSHLLVRRATT
jgi:hypothetical protein